MKSIALFIVTIFFLYSEAVLSRDLLTTNYSGFESQSNPVNAAQGELQIIQLPEGSSVSESGKIVFEDGRELTTEALASVRLPEGFATTNDGVILRDGELISLAESQALNRASNDANSSTTKRCVFGTEFFKFCGGIAYDESIEGFFTDIQAYPIDSESASVKLALLRYNIKLGDDWRLPFVLLTGNVLNSVSLQSINNKRVLDTDLGTLNFNVSYAGSYHIGPFCNFREVQGRCAVSSHLGIRYFDQNEDSKDYYGGYAGLKLSFYFPVANLSGGADAGYLGFVSGVNYYRTNADSDMLFPGLVDANGAELKFDSSFFGYSIALNFNVTDRLAFKFLYLSPIDNEALESTNELSIAYNFK